MVEDESREVVLKTKEYEPKTARGKAKAGCGEKGSANCTSVSSLTTSLTYSRLNSIRNTKSGITSNWRA